jgi:hypothetical protein
MEIVNDTINSSTFTSSIDKFHKLSDNWISWAHLPHNTDWSNKSFIHIFTFTTIEETICVTETIPQILVENCMLFLMREGIKPLKEDIRNRNGGCFSYKVSNKNVYKVWKDLTYVVVGSSICKNIGFVNSVTGISISPKKNFCVIKIWMTDCNYQNPAVITSDVKGLQPQGCLFIKHVLEY